MRAAIVVSIVVVHGLAFASGQYENAASNIVLFLVGALLLVVMTRRSLKRRHAG